MELLADKKIKCNYIYDEYINNEKLMEGLKGVFTLKLNESLRLIKFLEYIPRNINSKEKISKYDLIALRRDVLVANAIKQKLSGKEYDEGLYDYATKIDLNKLIEYKFDTFQFREKYNYFANLSEEQKQSIIARYESKFDLSTEELAFLSLIQETEKRKNRKTYSKKK